MKNDREVDRGINSGGAGRSLHPPSTSPAYYLPRGNGRYEPTGATESPWDRKAQHGGPPVALLAHVIDQTVEGTMRIGRISADFFGPIPLREVAVEVSSDQARPTGTPYRGPHEG